MLYLIALLGVIMHLLTKLVSAHKKIDFSFKIFFSMNWLTILFGVASAFTLIYIFVEPILETKELDIWLIRPVAFVCGWFASSILKKLVDKVKGKIDKKIDDV
jgi:hypothetical protein